MLQAKLTVLLITNKFAALRPTHCLLMAHATRAPLLTARQLAGQGNSLLRNAWEYCGLLNTGTGGGTTGYGPIRNTLNQGGPLVNIAIHRQQSVGWPNESSF